MQTILTQADKHLIRSLKRKSERDALGLFVAEGPKVVADLMPHFRCHLLIGGYDELEALKPWLNHVEKCCEMPHTYDYKSLSHLNTARPPIAIFHTPKSTPDHPPIPEALALLLDGVQDPGNLGTIIRTAHWFGIRQIYLSPGTADPYQSKVVQSTMGSLAQVDLLPLGETGLQTLLMQIQEHALPIYGTTLHGSPIGQTTLGKLSVPALLVMGNEGNGISSTVMSRLSVALTIPALTATPPDSLNVAIATALCLAEFARHG